MKRKKIKFGLPDDMKTGTLNDEYLKLLPFIVMYGTLIGKINDDDSKEFEHIIKEFDRKYKPGTPKGISDGMFMGYIHIDYRFGKAHETVIERLLKSEYVKKLNMPGPYYLQQISESCCSFYEVLKKKEHTIMMEELLTGERSELIRLHDYEDNATFEGQIWYVRLVGERSAKCQMMGPYRYDPEDKEGLCASLRMMKDKFMELSENKIKPEFIHREFMRAIVPKMIETIITGGAGGHHC